MITNKNSVIIKSQGKKFYKDICQQVENNNAKKDKGKDEGDNDIPQTM